MKLYVAPLIYCFLIPTVFADDENGGLKKDTAPPPPHALDEGYRGTENARIMTVQQAKSMHDGATISLRGNLIDGQGGQSAALTNGLVCAHLQAGETSLAVIPQYA